MNAQIMPPEEQDPGEGQHDLDKVLGSWRQPDVVFVGVGIYRPWDLGLGQSDSGRGGFHHANY